MGFSGFMEGTVRVSEVGGGKGRMSHHFRCLILLYHISLKHYLGKVKQGVVRRGVTILGVTIELLTVSFGSGESGGGSGPTVCSSMTEGTNSGAPWLPSKEGAVGGRRGRGGTSVCRDTIIHTLNV